MKTSTVLIGLLKYIILLAIVGYLGFVLIEIARPTKEMVCKDVVVELENGDTDILVTEADVSALLAKNHIMPKGKKFSSINPEQINRILNNSPLLDTAYCYRNSSSQLIICAQAPVPVMHVLPDEGKEFYLSMNGKPIPPTRKGRNLVVASGNITPLWAKENLLELAKEIKRNDYWRLQAQQVYVDKDHIIWLTTRIAGHKIKLGDGTMAANKLERIRLFYEKGLPQAGWNRYSIIDASYRGQLVCTKQTNKKNK